MGRKANEQNCLETNFPEIADQWHPTKNNELTPDKVLPFSNKKVWWKCPTKCEYGCLHEYEQAICDRTKGQGCPYCCYNARQICYHQTLKFLHPEIAKQWHPSKNNELTPDKVLPFSNKKVWWKCPTNCIHGCLHEYEQVIRDKTKGSGCPYCSAYGNAKKFCCHETVEYMFPNLAKEWHLDNEIKPNEITPGSGVKVWWKCIKNNTHEWEAVISSRTNGHGCPHCCVRFSKISLHWLGYINSTRDIQYGSTETGGEFRIPTTRYDADGYCEKTNTIYEFHGDLWHGNPQKYPKDAINPVTKTTYGELYERTQTKKQKILELGYNYIEMWESDWQRAIKCVIVLQRLYRKKAIGSHAH